MATSADLFVEVGIPGSATTLATPGHTVGGTTFKVINTAGFPAVGKSAIFAADTYMLQTVAGVITQVRNSGSYTEWEAMVTDSTTLSNAVIRYGTDQPYPSDGSTRIYIPVSSSRENRLVQGILNHSDQSGALLPAAVQTAIGTGGITSANIADGAVGATDLSASAIRLGYAQIISTFTTANSSATQVTGLSATVTIPAGGRSVKVSVFGKSMYNATSGRSVVLTIWDGVVGTGSQLSQTTANMATGTQEIPCVCYAVVTPSAGSKTYNVGLSTDGAGAVSINSASTFPAFILVEAI